MTEVDCKDCDNADGRNGADEVSGPGSTHREDPLDISPFIPPDIRTTLFPSLVIEFCDRCRWLHRAIWTQTELFLTFPPPMVKTITLVPRNDEETGGRFRVWALLDHNEGQGRARLVYDRKVEGGFPELKHLKQKVRDLISPATKLGHSDRHSGS